MAASHQQAQLVVPQFNYLETVKKMAAAGFAASVAEVVSIPMDTTKVRLQVTFLPIKSVTSYEKQKSAVRKS